MPNAGDDEVTTGSGASPIEERGGPGSVGKPGGKAAKKAAKAARREAEKAAKVAKRAAAKGAKVAKREAAKAAEVAKRDARAARKAAKKAAKAERAAAKDADKAPVAAAAGSLLQEVAGLVRQATEPAASRIVDRVTRRRGAEAAPEPEPAAAVPTEPVVPPAPALLAQPEPEPELPAAAELPAHLPAEPEPELPAASAAQPAAVDDVPASVAARGTAEPTDAAVEAAQDAPVADAGAAGREPEAELKADAEPKAGSAPEADGAPGPQPPASPPPPIEIPAGAVIGASVDVGATSVHLLVAAVGGHRVEPLLDESVFLGLGDRVSADGRLGPVARDELVAALVGYAGAARHLGASRITMVGTEPMRRAHDTAAVAAAVEARAGVPLHVLDHAEEGLLMLLGVTKGRPITSNLLVVDIGGGSSELVVVDRDGHEYAVGLALGANRLTRDLVRGDPPTMAELEAMRARARQVLAGAPDVQPGEIVAVGGTASNLLRLLPATALDRVLTRRRLTVALAMLTVERSMEAAERHLVRPARARILPAGAIIVDAILERYGADRMRVSDEGIREGLVLAAAVAGPAWRDRLPELVRGWTDEVLQTE